MSEKANQKTVWNGKPLSENKNKTPEMPAEFPSGCDSLLIDHQRKNIFCGFTGLIAKAVF